MEESSTAPTTGVKVVAAAPPMAHPNPWAAFRRTLVGFDRGALNVGRGLRNAVAVALPLCAGEMMHHPLPALVAATGALNVCFADGSDPYARRIRRMLGAVACVGPAVFFGAWLGGTVPGTVAAAAVWAFGTGMAMGLGTPVGNVAVTSLCVLLIFAARGMPPAEAALSGCAAVAGGLMAVGITALCRPRRGLEPERRSLARLYLELAELPARPVETTQSPAGSGKLNAAREVIDPLATTHNFYAERYRALLDQAERSRICLLTLRGLRERAREHPRGAELAAMLDAFLTASARAFRATGDALLATELRGGATIPDDHPAAESEAILESFRCRTGAAALPTLSADVQAQMDALTRQMRVSFAMAINAAPAGALAFARREAAHSWKLRVNSALGTLRANLSFRSAVFRHAVRLSICIAAAEVLAHVLAGSRGWNRPYWLPLTVAVVLKPDFSTTFSRGVLRLAGTFVGLGLATALFHVLPQRMPVEIALVAVFTFLLRWAGPANYGVLAVAVSALVVLLVAVTGVTPAGVIRARAENTALGGMLALLAYWLWPTWERTQMKEVFARLLEAYCRHWELLRRAYAEGEADPRLAAAMDRARLEARLARSNLEGSLDRLAIEPGTTAEQMSQWQAMLASSHIFVHSSIMLEANRLAPQALLAEQPVGEAFLQFMTEVAGTFAGLIATLRGRKSDLSFPNLREAHHRLVHFGEAAAVRHTLISVETDKIVNSLNTLREQVLGLPAEGR